MQVSEILPSSNLERFRLHIWLTNRLSNLNLNLAPKLPAGKDKDYLKKKNYGKVPKYVTKIKGEIEDEYNLVREMQIEEQNERDRQKMLMPEEERQELIAALKKESPAVAPRAYVDDLTIAIRQGEEQQGVWQ